MSADELITGEERIIAEFLAPLTMGDAGALGLKDDCAVMMPPPGHELVLTTDSLIEGVHFLPGEIPAFKALAVNVSDLVAKGATPRAYLLTLALPATPTRAFMQQLAGELRKAQAAFGCHLIGGDTDRTPGPFTLTIAAVGVVLQGHSVRRNGAREGDLVFVTGSIGDASLGLRLLREPELADLARLDAAEREYLLGRFARPTPLLAAALLVRRYARAAMDVSDGLVKDLGRLAAASQVKVMADVERVPLSVPASRMVAAGMAAREKLITGGEDYEVLFTVAPEQVEAMNRFAARNAISVTQIGEVVTGEGCEWRNKSGDRIEFDVGGWEHF